MKKLLLLTILFSTTFFFASGQSPVKATIKLKNGKTIEAYHFGKLKCESNAYASTFTILKGKFHDSHTEINDFKDINRLELSGFTAAPAPSVGNQKGTITAIKKDGVTVQLEDAELVMSCFNPADKYNEIHVQIVNPLTNQKADVAVAMKDIASITF
ncbi:MAG TPA: hypothetical protein VHI78_02290 [Bacteroidales bacterium]|nr:hypothetical protein [Bacteroidales bacterium]